MRFWYLFSIMICIFFLLTCLLLRFFFFSSRRRHTRYIGDWSSDVCSSDLVRAPATAHPEHFLSNLRSDPDVQGIEADTDVMFPEARPGLKVDQSTASILDTLSHRTLVPFYGSPVLSSYVNQPAIMLIRSAEAHQLATGAGIVAVIDTGVDPNHPVLKASLVPGFDFTRNLPGIPSEFADLGQSTASLLDQP